MDVETALAAAIEQGLDLVEVAPMARPPVARIMDYGKFKFEQAKMARQAKKKQHVIHLKEVKFRPKIGKGDFDTKVRHMQDFLAVGHKVKVTLQFRGREMAHPELGSRILDAVIEQVGSHGKVETMARLEGRNMTMVLAPEKKAVVKKAHEPKAAAHDGPVTRNTAAADASAPVQQAQAPEAPVADEPADQAETA